MPDTLRLQRRKSDVELIGRISDTQLSNFSVFESPKSTKKKKLSYDDVNWAASIPTLPVLKWIRQYDKTKFRQDCLAGLSVAVLLVPQAMAYAQLADLPPRFGLYSSVVPIIVYSLLTDTTMTAIGPVAPTCIMISSALSSIGAETEEDKIEIAMLMTFVVGVILFCFAFFQLGFIVKFLSRPVMTGFCTGAACIIASSQLKGLFRLEMEKTPYFYSTVYNALAALPSLHFPTAAMSIFSCFILIGAKLWKVPRWIPIPLMLIVVMIVISAVADLESAGFELVGNIPTGLPGLNVPNFSLLSNSSIWINSLVLGCILYLASIGLSSSFAVIREEKIDSNQELYAYALSHLSGCFFQSHVVSASFSRTAINNALDGATQVSSMIQCSTVMLCLLFLTAPLEVLPTCVLSALIFASVISLFKYDEFIFLWRVNKPDAFCFAATVIGTLTIGIEPGIMVGVVVSLMFLIARNSSPEFVELGLLEATHEYVDVRRFTTIQTVPDVYICQYRNELFYANVELFEKHIFDTLMSERSIHVIVIDFSLVPYVDSGGVRVLAQTMSRAKDKFKVDIYFACARWPVRDKIQKGFTELEIPVRFFLNIGSALQFFESQKNMTPEEIIITPEANLNLQEADLPSENASEDENPRAGKRKSITV